MFGLHYSSELDEATKREFDALAAKLRIFLLAEHNEDGTHNFSPEGSGESAGLNPGINASVDLIIDHAQARGQWWKQGPWHLDNPDGAERHKVLLRPPTLVAGTYNNYSPQGIDTAVGMELNISGNITITGIKALEGLRTKRLLFLRNRSTSYTITFTHQGAGSIASNRFSLPSSASAACGPNQAIWLYYDPLPTAAWTLASGNATSNIRTITAVFDGLSNEIVDNTIVYVSCPVGGTITGWRLIARESGSIVIDVWKDVFANHPPTDADSITATFEPELASQDQAEDVDLSNWSTVAITAGDIIAFNVDSCTTITWASLQLQVSV